MKKSMLYVLMLTCLLMSTGISVISATPSDRSSLFTYTGDKLPSSDGWAIVNYPAYETTGVSIVDGTLHINDQNTYHGSAIHYKREWNVVPEFINVAEFDIKGVSCSGKASGGYPIGFAGIFFGISDGKHNIGYTLYPNRVVSSYTNNLGNPIIGSTYYVDTTTGFNTYKVFIEDGIAKLFINEELILEESAGAGIGDIKGIYFGSGSSVAIGEAFFDEIRAYTTRSPILALASFITIEKTLAPYSIRQFQETVITISIENTGTTDATDIEITDTIHPSFDLLSGDFPNPKRYDLIRPGETRDLQYTISAKESGTFTLDPATVTYADEDGNIQEVLSEQMSIKVIPSTEGSTSGGTSHNPSVSTASVQLHGEKTDVVLGEDILLKLSAVNLITKPTMHVQVIIIPPSGMSVTSSAFAKSGAGQYTTTYELKPGTGKDIEVAIRSNQVGDFDVNGRIIYYFGDEREHAEDHTLNLPIKVRAEPGAEQAERPSESDESKIPGFEAVVAITGLLAIYMRKRI